ncbi:putative CRM1-nuclear export factor, exportin [Ceraceosorus guamensis]|uniref:Putative CRM1-nuclear export factor, exportin n=1 Tax=Ceraceosorus guamensis TaxID=1522189 RepID=A0A316VVP7_9BASI|nr:putative CRM1-nuclear export factor, exportin [Ceraceosorus guamensis]PWN41529.1 putative CRM1-nuclear export factor, exportin [Ceraceosorus guamensis]
MDGILDFSQDLDVSLLDRVVGAMFGSAREDQRMAQQVLAQFQEHPEAWQRVPAILQQSSSEHSKYIALQILDKLILTKWKALAEDQQQGIRNFIVETIIGVSSDEASLRAQRTYLKKLNVTLVQILKQEWPHKWPTFISDIVSSSRTSLSICQNNMAILRLLSEEIFDFSPEQMTTTKTQNLKNQICGEFAEVFQLCTEVLEKAQRPSLIQATLETMLKFLNWIPLGYIFETNVIDQLINRFLEVPEYRNVTLKCLSEIAGLQIKTNSYDEKFVVLFNMVMTSVNRMIPPSTNFAEAYESSSNDDQELILNLALFLCNFLNERLHLVENAENREVLLNAHLYLIKVSQVPEREIFKICLEYWSKLVASLYEEMQTLPMAEMNPLIGLSLGNGSSGAAASLDLRKHTYGQILSNLRLVMIERMVKPEEVLVVENDEGEIVREFMKESDTIVLYKSMREVLVYLTHLDTLDTEEIMTQKLSKQVDGSEWSWGNLNTLCWAIGSISGAMSEDAEKRFLVTVIKDLLGLCEMKRGKDNKAVVASNIMYIVGQYPRFLKAHWKFLKTVVNKNFEFMHETHEGVQDMACDTFIKIAQKCRRHFVMQQKDEQEPFIDEILRTLHRITVDLQAHQVHTFYEAVGYMIAAQPNKPTQERLISKLMELPNSAWDSLMSQAHSNVDVLNNSENIKILSNVLKTNVSACFSIGTYFLPQIGRIYLDMLALYRSVSGVISAKVESDGLIATKTPLVRGLRTIKKDILHLVETYVKRAEDLEQVNVNLIPSLLDAILGDYHNNVPPAREAEVLNVMTTITARLGALLTDKISPILDAVFEPTLGMINRDFAEYPEHRVGFFKLLRAINAQCFPAMLSLDPSKFKLFVDALVWAFKHAQRDVAEQGLNTMLELFANVAQESAEVSAGFYQQYLLPVVQDVFFVLTEPDHKAGFRLQCMLLARIFATVAFEKVSVPLAEGVTDNHSYLLQYCSNLLKTAFPHVDPKYVDSFLEGLSKLSVSQDPTMRALTFRKAELRDLNMHEAYHSDLNGRDSQFRSLMRDFLLTTRELAGSEGDNQDLFQDDKAEKAAAEAAEAREKAAAVPGMLKPSEITKDEDEEI